jgi:hypothetical protein
MDRPSLLCLYDMQVSSSSAPQIKGPIFVLLTTTSGIGEPDIVRWPIESAFGGRAESDFGAVRYVDSPTLAGIVQDHDAFPDRAGSVRI